jgi:hypothetical protein
VVHNPVKGVKRPKSNVNAGLTPALSDEQARLLLNAPLTTTLKGKRDRAYWQPSSITVCAGRNFVGFAYT